MMEELNESQAKYEALPKQKEVENEPIKQLVSLEAYLEMIADGERRLEYHDGEVIDIQSATQQHGLICTNLTRLVGNCILDKDCNIYAGDRELWIKECRKMFYPDHIIVCGEHDLKKMSKNVKATINPSVVVEVLSESTEKRDLTTKMRCYKTLKSLKQIIFIAQSEKYILSLERDKDNDRLWLDMEYFEDDERIPIGDCEILLKDIYYKVTFENQSESTTDNWGVTIEELDESQAKYEALSKQKEVEDEPQKQLVSLETYLEMIADGERRLEYHDGEVIDIQSTTQPHGRIAFNLSGLVSNCLTGKDCEGYAGDREVWIKECNKVFYPDLVIVCGEEEFHQMSKNVKATINPAVVIEVLSVSTGNYDKTVKSRCYKKLKSIKQIIYVAQDDKYIYIETPTENERVWETTDYFEDDDLVPIGECSILLKDIYRKVIFDNQPKRAIET